MSVLKWWWGGGINANRRCTSPDAGIGWYGLVTGRIGDTGEGEPIINTDAFDVNTLHAHNSFRGFPCLVRAQRL